MKEILVKKGRTIVSDSKNTQLIAPSLGAALAVGASDPFANVSGMAVCILPQKTDKTSPMPDVLEQMRELFKDLIAKGAKPQNLKIFLAGAGGFIDEPDEIAIGKRLYKAVIKTLKKNGLKLSGEHVGGPLNRTASIRVGEKHMTITMLDEKEIQL